MADHYSVRHVNSNGNISNEPVSTRDSLAMAEQARSMREEATGEFYIVAISRGEAIRRSSAILERCEKARLPPDEPEKESPTSKRTITVEIACGRWTCDECHLLDPDGSACGVFPEEGLRRNGDLWHLCCDPCLERDPDACADRTPEICLGCDFLQREDQCDKLHVRLESIWRASVGRINLRTKTCRLHRMKVVKGQRESEE